MSMEAAGARPGAANPLNDPVVRGIVAQVALVALVGFLLYEAVTNAIENLNRQNIASGFGFFNNVAGFDISQRPISYDASSTYFRAFLVGLLNTLIVAVIGVVLATVLGFLIGIARLSKNWIVARLATVYVETLRNLPLLLQLLFWYGAVLKPLPGPRQSLALALPVIDWPSPGLIAIYGLVTVAGVMLYRLAVRRSAGFLARLAGGLIAAAGMLLMLFGSGLIHAAETPSVFLNNRGLSMPSLVFGEGARVVGIALLIGVGLAVAVLRHARRQREETGRAIPAGPIALAAVIGLPLAAFVLLGAPVTVETPALKGFNLAGGFTLTPAFVALLVGLSTYTAAFIAEIVRAGILAVSKGQTEAAHALGLGNGQTLRLVVVPQAMRVIIPPLTSQYLNLVKNSSLAVAIGYPDLVQVFAGTVLNQTGQAIEVIAITMAVYLTISLLTSFGMNLYNRRVALVER